MTTPGAHREGQRPAPSPAQGKALGTRATPATSPERANQPLFHGSAAPSRLMEFAATFPGRCPGLSWFGPLALRYPSLHQGQRPDLIPAQGNALGQKGRPNLCHNPLPEYRSIWSSAPSIANAALQMTCVLRCMPTWQPSCKTWTAQLFSLTRLTTIFTSCLNWREPRRSARSLKQSRLVHQNGSRPRAMVTPFSHGKPDTGHFQSANHRSLSCVTTSLASKSIIDEKLFRKNIAVSWSGIVSGTTNGMFGIRSAHLTQGVALGYHGSGLWPSR